MRTLIGETLLVLGAGFCFLGALGLVRMPDVYNRIQAGAKASTLGALGLLAGVGCLHPQWWNKLVLIALFILLTNPIGSSTLARAAYISGLVPWRNRTVERPREEEGTSAHPPFSTKEKSS